jgi:rhodanese-related sulfurtransferase
LKSTRLTSITALNEGERIVIVDTRQRHAFEDERIPRAVGLPYREIDQATPKILTATFCTSLTAAALDATPPPRAH